MKRNILKSMLKAVLIVSVILWTSTSIFSQWTTNTDVNTLVVESGSGDMQAIGTSDGQTYVVYWKTVAAPTNYELRLQLLDADGYKQFGDDGMLISNTIPMSTYTVLWSIAIDNEDHLYVGATSTQDMTGRLFKLDTDGNNLWTSNGVSIAGTAFKITLSCMQNGELLASWASDSDTKLQKYDTDGNAIWAFPQTVSGVSGNTAPEHIFEMSNNGILLVFHEISYSIYSSLYAQSYDADGEPLWSVPTQLSNVTTMFNTYYSGTQDGDVVYLGYFGSHSNRFDSYVQRINPDGSLPWGINGMDFDVNQTNFEMDTKIAYSPGTSYIWAICTYTDPNQSMKGEYIQKLNKETGARQFTDYAKVIYNISNDDKMHSSNLYFINGQPFFLLKTGFDNGASPVSLHALLLDENGDFVWPEETRPVATYPASKSRIQFTKPFNGQSVSVFIENKSFGDKIYAQNIIEEGNQLDAPQLIAPENEATEVPKDAEFSWEEVTDAETYSIQIAEDDGFSALVADENGITALSFNFSLPDYQTTYYWRVKAGNSESESDWSEIWSFTTDVNTAVNQLNHSFKTQIFPQPAIDQITIQSSSDIEKIEIYNLFGQLIFSNEYKNNQIRINLEKFAKGNYLINIYSEEGLNTEKILIE